MLRSRQNASACSKNFWLCTDKGAGSAFLHEPQGYAFLDQHDYKGEEWKILDT